MLFKKVYRYTFLDLRARQRGKACLKGAVAGQEEEASAGASQGRIRVVRARENGGDLYNPHTHTCPLLISFMRNRAAPDM